MGLIGVNARGFKMIDNRHLISKDKYQLSIVIEKKKKHYIYTNTTNLLRYTQSLSKVHNYSQPRDQGSMSSASLGNFE